MNNRSVPIILIVLLGIIHAQLWFGRGSLPSVARMTDQLSAQNLHNQQALLVNNQLAAEVRDLREGLEMVEEKARSELGMVRANEIYVQIAK